MRNSTFFVLLVLVSCFLASCASESQQITDQLIGSWQLEIAYRNSEETTTLRGAFIKFTDDGMMESNLPYSRTIRDPYKKPFKVEDSRLLSPEIPEFDFTIHKLENGKLVLSTKLVNIPFEFHFRKKGG